jgi:hypothetical protein
MHRQLVACGGLRKHHLPGNKNCVLAQTNEETQQHLTKVEPTPIGPTGVVVRRQPLQNDVICARGRTYWDHPGNQLYRKLISLAKNQYSKAPNRLGKSLIVSEIIRHIHHANGRFMKKLRRKDGDKWVECSLNFVREKVTQSLRDGLSFKYSSSTERKRQRKAKSQELIHGDIDRIVHSNASVSQKISDFKHKIEWVNRYRGTEGEGISDERILKFFEQTNLDILETMKNDPSMLEQMHRITNTETTGKRNDRNSPTRSLSPPIRELTVQLAIFAPQQAPLNISTDANNARIQLDSSLTPLLRSNKADFHIRSFENKQGGSLSDDIDLDLDSPFMFRDEISRHNRA